MTHHDLGQISSDGDVSAVRLERDLDSIPEEVWRALTEPERTREWFARTKIDPKDGGEVEIDFSDEPEGGIVRGVIRIYDPPHTLEYDWSEEGSNRSIVRFELEPSDSGTKLILTHRLLTEEEVPSFAAGWHSHLESLVLLMQGTKPSRDHFAAMQARYEELRPIYTDLAKSVRS